jgi:hypothetical protein
VGQVPRVDVGVSGECIESIAMGLGERRGRSYRRVVGRLLHEEPRAIAVIHLIPSAPIIRGRSSMVPQRRAYHGLDRG